MKHFLLVGFILSFLSCSRSGNSTDNNFSVYTNKERGFSLSYPAKWDTTRKDSRVAFMAEEGYSDSSDKFSEGLNVTILNNEGKTLTAIADQNIEFIKQYYPKAEIKKKESKNKNGLENVVIEVKQVVQGLSFNSRSAFFIKGRDLFTLTQTFEAD